jgi:hypothetical protein
MRPKSIIAWFALVSLSFALFAGGCRRYSGQAQTETGDQTQNIAPSDVKPEGKAAANASDKSSDKAPEAAETNSIVDKGGEDVDFPERQEIRRSYTLNPNAEVSVNNINGRVEVETANVDTAEVLIVRSARKKEDFQFRKINIEHIPDSLHIRVEEDRKSIFSSLGMIPEGRQRVMLKLPRKVRLETNGVNGHVTIGEIDGSVQVRGVNGKVNIAQATGEASFRGVNGNIDATIAKLSGDGIGLSGLNGGTILRFIGEVNADVEARGFNGRVESELPNTEERKGEKRYGRYKARIGTGGAQIEIRGVNGNVRLVKAEKADTVSAKTAAKTAAKKEAIKEPHLKDNGIKLAK